MSYYMEKRLLELHVETSKQGFVEKLLTTFIAYLTVLLIPFVHLGLLYSFWSQNKPVVDPHVCTCSCFDTIFRGKYEWPPSTYKHIYFNTTKNTFKIFAFSVFGIISCYEVIQYIVSLVRRKNYRLSFILLFVSSIYPHYYGLWNFFQYLNEGFYDQWNHQLFFSVTELLSTLVIVHLCNQYNPIKAWKLLLVVCVSCVHVVVASTDQFLNNVLAMNGQDFEVMRDIGLTTPDFLTIIVCFSHMRLITKNQRIMFVLRKEEIMLFILCFLLLTLLAKAL